MYTPEVSKQSLGMGYVMGAGVVLTLSLLAHAAIAVRVGSQAVFVVGVGLLPALALVAANYWLPRSGLDGDAVWTVAEWAGLGIALVTLATLLVYVSSMPLSALVVGILASSVAVGGFVGILVGAVLELRRARARLSQSNDVLNRVLRHDMRNDLNVAMGHLSRLERTANEESAPHVEALGRTVDEMVTTCEKARQIDVALGADRRSQHPVDVVPYVERRAAALSSAFPDATVEVEAPASLRVHADWLLGSVLDNLLENAVVHGGDAPSVAITVEDRGSVARIHLVDDGPPIPTTELEVFAKRVETPLQHSKGVGLWLVIWVVESYGGEVTFGRTEDGRNLVTLELRTATWFEEWRATDPLGS